MNALSSWLKWDTSGDSKELPLGDYSIIIDDFLYLSDIVFVQELFLTQHEITTVCSITAKDTLTPLKSTTLRLSLPISDSSHSPISSHFAAAHEFIEQARKENKKVVVHCEVGMSRSPTIVISYLMKYKNINLREAYNLVKSRRPIIQPNVGFIKQLLAYENELFGKQDTLFLAEYIKDVYKLEQNAQVIHEALLRENLDVNKAMLSLYPA